MARTGVQILLTALLGATIALASIWGYTRAKGPRVDHLANGYDHPKAFYLLDVMHQLQRYADKIYFAGRANNARLTEWYVWKLEAAASNIKEGQVEPYGRNGWDTQELVAMLDAPVERLYEVAEKKDWAAFDAAYGDLVMACNACHDAAEHGYVRIKVPDGEPIYSNQDYAPAAP